MLKEFKKRVIGQDHIFDTVCNYIKIGEAGLAPDNEPRGAFLFLGPTGTGKTETAKVMADMLAVPLIRFDMSEYSNPTKWLNDFAFKLEGKAKGIILLDEIEKGAKEIMDYFLQILSEAKITVDRKEINVRNFYIIMTSNIGSKNLLDQNFKEMKFTVEIRVRGYFRPEFLGRFHRNCILCFKPFDYDTITEIAHLKVRQEIKRLENHGYSLTYSETIIPKLVFYVSLDRDLGARPLVQAIQEIFPAALLDSGKKSGRFDVQNGRIALL